MNDAATDENNTKSSSTCASLAISHYKDTFRPKLSARRPNAFQPPPDAHYFVPRGTMQFDTVNKSDFKAYENPERSKSMKQIDKYEKSDEKLSGTTSYNAEYFAKQLKKLGSSHIVKKNSNQTT